MLCCWVAVETTGVSPRLDHILEVALVVTGPDLVAVSALSLITNPSLGRHGANWSDRMDERTQRLHTSTGLLREVQYAPSLAHVDEAMAAILKPLDDKFICCGYNPSFHRSFVREQMPGLSSRLSDSSFDVVSVRRLIRDFASREDLIPELSRAHRAMSNVQDALTEARVYASYLALIPVD